jgi:hypothetical protein
MELLFAYALHEDPAPIVVGLADPDILDKICAGCVDASDRYSYVLESDLGDFLLEHARNGYLDFEGEHMTEDECVHARYMEMLRETEDPVWSTAPLEYTLGLEEGSHVRTCDPEGARALGHEIVAPPPAHYLFIWGEEGGRLAMVAEGTREKLLVLQARWDPLVRAGGGCKRVGVDTVRHGYAVDARQANILVAEAEIAEAPGMRP